MASLAAGPAAKTKSASSSGRPVFAGLRYRFSDYDDSAIRVLRIAP